LRREIVKALKPSQTISTRLSLNSLSVRFRVKLLRKKLTVASHKTFVMPMDLSINLKAGRAKTPDKKKIPGSRGGEHGKTQRRDRH
jgi:hypothetical protein